MAGDDPTADDGMPKAVTHGALEDFRLRYFAHDHCSLYCDDAVQYCKCKGIEHPPWLTEALRWRAENPPRRMTAKQQEKLRRNHQIAREIALALEFFPEYSRGELENAVAPKFELDGKAIEKIEPPLRRAIETELELPPAEQRPKADERKTQARNRPVAVQGWQGFRAFVEGAKKHAKRPSIEAARVIATSVLSNVDHPYWRPTHELHDASVELMRTLFEMYPRLFAVTHSEHANDK